MEKKEKRKVQLIGPMNGIENKNREEFARYAKLWRDAGWFVLDPGEFFDPQDEPSQSEACRKSTKHLLDDAEFGAVIPSVWDYPGSFGHVEMELCDRFGIALLDADYPKECRPPSRRILLEADQLICGKRQETYGDPKAFFENVQELWNAHIKNKIYNEKASDVSGLLGVWDIPVMMELFKIARLYNDHLYRDTWRDMAGYVGAATKALELDP